MAEERKEMQDIYNGVGSLSGEPEAPIESAYTEAAGLRVSAEDVKKAAELLRTYRSYKADFDDNCIENERWWRLRHWDTMKGRGQAKSKEELEYQESRIKPSSAWLLNSLMNKHADCIDNIPEANVLPRAKDDEEAAKTISSVLPVIMERNNFDRIFDKLAWRELKTGICAVSVVWDRSISDGLGDVLIKPIDTTSIFWNVLCDDVQESEAFFFVSVKNTEDIKRRYPEAASGIKGGISQIRSYIDNPQEDTSDKCEVVDWYYKKDNGVHLCRFVGGTVLYSSENEGISTMYKHGKYPICIGGLFPMEGTSLSFGYLDIMKSPQIYVDKLNQLYLESISQYSKNRYFVKKSSGVNIDDFMDLTKGVVEVESISNIAESISPIQTKSLDNGQISLLQMKIDELKETSANRDFNQGSAGGGITSGAAISALQEAGNKTSRDMLTGLYSMYADVCYLVIELIRQFYDLPRTFRITGDKGETEYVSFDNAAINTDKKPIFDIKVKPQRKNPYSRATQNQLGFDLYSAGVFNPENAEQALGLLDVIDFEGKEKIIERVTQGQTMQMKIAALSSEVEKCIGIIEQLTGNKTEQEPKANAEETATAQNPPRIKNGENESGETELQRQSRKAATVQM